MHPAVTMAVFRIVTHCVWVSLIGTIVAMFLGVEGGQDCLYFTPTLYIFVGNGGPTNVVL